MWMHPFIQPPLDIDLRRIEAFVDVAVRRDNGFHVLAGTADNCWVARGMLEKTQELLQNAGEKFVKVNDDFDEKSLSEHTPGTLFFFSELRDQNENDHFTKLAEKCLDAGGTVFAVVHGGSIEGVIRRLHNLGMPQTLIERKLKVEDFIRELC